MDKMVEKTKWRRFRNVDKTQWEGEKKKKKRRIQVNIIRWGQKNINHKFSRQRES